MAVESHNSLKWGESSSFPFPHNILQSTVSIASTFFHILVSAAHAIARDQWSNVNEDMLHYEQSDEMKRIDERPKLNETKVQRCIVNRP